MPTKLTLLVEIKKKAKCSLKSYLIKSECLAYACVTFVNGFDKNLLDMLIPAHFRGGPLLNANTTRTGKQQGQAPQG